MSYLRLAKRAADALRSAGETVVDELQHELDTIRREKRLHPEHASAIVDAILAGALEHAQLGPAFKKLGPAGRAKLRGEWMTLTEYVGQTKERQAAPVVE